MYLLQSNGDVGIQQNGSLTYPQVNQLMLLPLTVSCFSKIQIGFTFLVTAHPGSPGKMATKRVYVCVFMLLICLHSKQHRNFTGFYMSLLSKLVVDRIWIWLIIKILNVRCSLDCLTPMFRCAIIQEARLVISHHRYLPLIHTTMVCVCHAHSPFVICHMTDYELLS